MSSVTAEISKGILFSRTTAFAKIVKAVVIFIPNSEKRDSTCFFKSSSIRILILVCAIINTPFTIKYIPVSYTHLRAHETRHDLVCRLLLEKKKKNQLTDNE